MPQGLRAINPRAEGPVTLRFKRRDVKCKKQLWETEEEDDLCDTTPTMSPKRPTYKMKAKPKPSSRLNSGYILQPLMSSTPRSHFYKKKPLLDTSRCDFDVIAQAHHGNSVSSTSSSSSSNSSRCSSSDSTSGELMLTTEEIVL